MRTTINIKKDLVDRLTYTSGILKISTNDLIAMLIGTVFSKNDFCITAFRKVRYQEPAPFDKWRKLHVRFEPQVYEKGLDLRKIFKVSVSLLISFAIVHYLDEIIEDIKDGVKEVDNYQRNYIFVANISEKIQSYTIYWGIPSEKTLKNLIH